MQWNSSQPRYQVYFIMERHCCRSTVLHSWRSTIMHSCLGTSEHCCLGTVWHSCWETDSQTSLSTGTHFSLGTCWHCWDGIWRQTLRCIGWHTSLGTDTQFGLLTFLQPPGTHISWCLEVVFILTRIIMPTLTLTILRLGPRTLSMVSHFLDQVAQADTISKQWNFWHCLVRWQAAISSKICKRILLSLM